MSPGPHERDPQAVRCWLVGGGIGCLAAAVHLMEVGVPGTHIHFIEGSSQSNQSVATFGNADDGYTIHAGLQPYFHDPCVEDLLRLVPDPSNLERSLNEIVKDDARRASQIPTASTRLLVQGKSGPERSDTERLHMRLQDRLDLAKMMIDSEENLGDKSIRQVLDTEFFASKFWILWSTTFALQPWHSAKEFRRHLRKYLPEIQHLNDSHIFGRVQITLYDSIIRPIAEYLKKKGVDFWDDAKIKAIVTDPRNDHTTVTRIDIQSQEGKDISFPLGRNHICIINPGPIASTVALGSNFTSPEPLGRLVEGAMNPDWSLWYEMSTKSLKLGHPSNFCSRVGESNLVTFTTTLKNSSFIELYTKLTGNQPGAGAFMTLGDSNWCLTINVPQQPVFHSQPENVHVIWGYGLNSPSDGNFVPKPMYNCTGQEIMKELLSHLHFPLDPILDSSITIPCLIPYATSAMVTRKEGDRPEVIPPGTTNMGIVGQFVEIPDETSFSMEYSVRGAQLAVSRLMGTKEPKKLNRNRLLGAFDVLA